MFNTVEGVAKCGAYSGSNNTLTLSFDFHPKFIMIKRQSGSGDWCIFDSLRGFSTGNDPLLKLNTWVEQTSTSGNNAVDYGGFGANINYNTKVVYLNGNITQTNKEGEKYIYYAIG